MASNSNDPPVNGNSADAEHAPLLGTGPPLTRPRPTNLKVRATVHGILVAVFVVGLFVVIYAWEGFGDVVGGLPKDPKKAAEKLLQSAPVIDGHIDLPILVREYYGNNASAFDLKSPMIGHVDIPRLREGRVGGFFWSVYVGCPRDGAEGEDFVNATWRVRDTLEQIDIAKVLIDKYSDTFSLATTSTEVKEAISRGKIASLIGIEGGHQLGNSIAVLRQMHALGVRYVTLTHSCHNAFADSCGLFQGIEPKWGGLSPLGKSLIKEMNRLGVLVDLSHTSDDTARQALSESLAPVIWSHSSSRAVHDVPRNVPDDVLRLVGTESGKKDAVVMVNFSPGFVAKPGKADVAAVADHVDHIALIAGKQHVGLGSDYDGIQDTPKGLEDVSKYPALIAELYKRGWNRWELAGLTGRNLLRVMQGAEKVSAELRGAGVEPSYIVYDKRTDLPRGEF